MPGIDGLEVVQRLRRDGVSTTVVFLTARDAPADRVKGLHLGGDDYITKPFSLEELLARIEAVLRRVRPNERWTREMTVTTSPSIATEGRSPGGATHRDVTHGVQPARVPLMNAGRVVSKQQILEYVWQYDFGGESTVSRRTSRTCARSSTRSARR